jgi:hypothetical protein
MTGKFNTSSSAWDRPFSVGLGASRWLLVVLTAVHGAAVLAVCLAAIPALLAMVSGATVAAAGFRNLSLHATRSARNAITGVERDGRSRWWIVRADGRRQAIDSFSSIYVSAMVVILAIRCEGARRSEGVVICADATDRAPFLKLRRALLH